MADYVPFGETPIETRPFGPVEGVISADKSFLARQAQMQSLYDMFVANQQRQAELERYRGMTPGELDKSAFEGAQARGRMGILPELLKGEVGVAQGKAAEGRSKAETVDSDIAAVRSKNQKQMTADEVANLGNIVSMYHAQMSSNPLMAPYLYDQMRRSLPENVRNQFPTEYSPKVLEGLGNMKQGLAQTIPHIQEMEKEKLKKEADIERARIAARATVEAARTRANSQVKDLMTRFEEAASKGDNERVINTGTMLLQTDLDERDRQMITATIDTARRNQAAKLAPRYAPPIGTLPGTDPNQVLRHLAPTQNLPGNSNVGIPGVNRVTP